MDNKPYLRQLFSPSSENFSVLGVLRYIPITIWELETDEQKEVIRKKPESDYCHSRQNWPPWADAISKETAKVWEFLGTIRKIKMNISSKHEKVEVHDFKL